MNWIKSFTAFFILSMLGLWITYPSFIWIGLFLFFILTGVFVYQQNWHFPLALIIAFALPLSLELPFIGNHKWFFPSELLLAVSAVAFVLVLFKDDFREYDLWPAVWLLSFIPSLVFSEDTVVSLKFVTVNTTYVVVFYYGTQFLLRMGCKVKKMLDIYVLALVPVMVWSAWQFVQYDANPVTLPGIFKPFYNDHTIVGAVLSLLAGFYLAFVKEKPIYTVLLLLLLAGVTLSGSRAALLSILPMLVFYAAVRSSLFRRLLPLGFSILLIVAFLSRDALYVQFAHNTSGSRELDFNERVKSIMNVSSDASNVERLNRWLSAWRMFKERPLTGFGPGTYQFHYIPYQDDRFRNRLTVTNPDNPPLGSGGTAHSELFLQLSEAGAIPVIVFLVMLGRWVYFGWGYAIQNRVLPFAALLGLVTYFFHMNFNNFLTTDAFAFLFWSFGALVMHKSIKS